MPVWAKINTNLLTEKSYLEKASKIVSFDFYKVEGRALYPVLPKDLEYSQYIVLRPSVNVSEGWKLSVPNLRQHSVKILLRKDF
jgi:hypothetical protein